MRHLLLALPLALLPLTTALAQSREPDTDHAHEHEAHSGLEAHEHGVAHLNAALDGNRLELELESPAMNLVGFERAAQSEGDQAAVVAARSELEKPLTLFGIPKAAHCALTSQELESPLLGGAQGHHEEHDEGHEHEGEHSEIHAHYQLTCLAPDALEKLDLTELFKRFPATEKIQVQLIGPQGQQGAELSRANTTLSF